MAGMRDIKRRIRSVKSTQQITRAMKMVAAAKLRKAQDAVVAARPYSDNLRSIIKRLIPSLETFTHPLLEEKEEGKTAYVVIAADKGLCGGYNQNILKACKTAMDNDPGETAVVVIGRKGRDFFLRRGYEIRKEYLDFGDLPDFIQTRELARELMAMFTDGEFKKMHFVYTEFGSAISQKPQVMQLLPIEAEEAEDVMDTKDNEYIYEPSEEEVLGTLFPRFIEMTVYRALLEAKASEHGARMAAMSSATENAQEMIEKLTLIYNRARQAAITKEISEIVGGADALK